MNRAQLKKVVVALFVFLVVIQILSAQANEPTCGFLKHVDLSRPCPAGSLFCADALLRGLPFDPDPVALV